VIYGFSPTQTALPSGSEALVAVRAERLTPGDRGEAGRLNVVPCTPAKQLYRGKYIDQTADTPIGPIKLRTWDRAAASDCFDAVAWRAEDCVVLPR
jgi:hypothetical protein